MHLSTKTTQKLLLALSASLADPKGDENHATGSSRPCKPRWPTPKAMKTMQLSTKTTQKASLADPKGHESHATVDSNDPEAPPGPSNFATVALNDPEAPPRP